MKPIVEKQSPHAATELVACEVLCGADFGCVWHHHPECEITLVRRGGTERFVGDKLTPLTPGDLVFLGPDLPHDFRNHATPGKRRVRVDAIVVQFMPHLLGEGWLHRASMGKVRRLFVRSALGLEVRGRTRQRTAKRLSQIVKARGLRRVGLLLELLEDLARSKELKEIASPGFYAPVGSATSDRIGVVCAHIEQHLAAPLYAAKLAGLASLSESAFSRLFKRCTLRTLPQYVNELRIAHACRLLAETDHTVSEIANACGYPTPAHFQRQFQKLERRAPLAYRRAVRKLA